MFLAEMCLLRKQKLGGNRKTETYLSITSTLASVQIVNQDTTSLRPIFRNRFERPAIPSRRQVCATNQSQRRDTAVALQA